MSLTTKDFISHSGWLEKTQISTKKDRYIDYLVQSESANNAKIAKIQAILQEIFLEATPILLPEIK